ncbi:hypothetical protein K443DRAFT_676157 [Laccaria amethystina LaAM-08-1]|uniref:Uncharacterized protein n=1 Tax=Laccaria amethystina LaAM-08-1 TaxID=1095629 RepID=A0A0C9Y296_9AGAR|nr:hypothetical protein K443DRAFT_676157 [Laccaria amethystina LaAM-08-1]
MTSVIGQLTRIRGFIAFCDILGEMNMPSPARFGDPPVFSVSFRRSWFLTSLLMNSDLCHGEEVGAIGHSKGKKFEIPFRDRRPTDAPG